MEIILDNSVIELGGAVDLDVIIEAAKIVRPTTTVLPDVLLDTDATIANCDRALTLDAWGDAFQAAGLEADFMIVPQGKTLEDWVRCAEFFADHKQINWWGIPRNVVKTQIGSRRSLPDIARALNPYRQIHLLGYSDDPVDDILTSRNRWVSGIDSAVPLRAVTQGVPRTIKGFSNMPPRGDWWDTCQFDRDMLDAVSQARQWFKS